MPGVAETSPTERLDAVERLIHLFRLERMVHLFVTSISLVMLLASAAAIISDIQLVALTLIGAGIKIRTVEPLLPHVSKPRLIQIGADLRTRDAPPLTVEKALRTSFTN